MLSCMGHTICICLSAPALQLHEHASCSAAGRSSSLTLLEVHPKEAPAQSGQRGSERVQKEQWQQERDTGLQFIWIVLVGIQADESMVQHPVAFRMLNRHVLVAMSRLADTWHAR